MAHPLEDVMANASGLVLIGDSSNDRFPAFSYNAYAKTRTPFYCLDIGGLTESRGPTEGGKVYTSVDELPEDHSDLAVIWVKPRQAKEAVDLAHQAGCTRVWFSFSTGHPDAVAHARELGMEVIEIGRCPVYYMKNGDKPAACKGHTMLVKASGSYKKPPQTDATAKRRELW